MTVTWPLPPGTTLADPTRPIVFTTERDVSAISVALGSRRIEERAYRDGAFVWPYLPSTRSGNLFTLVRDDGEAGWPADPKPFVDEEPPPPLPPVGGQPWGAIYQADLSTVAVQNFTTLGDHTFAGAIWTLKGNFSWTGGYVESSRTDGTALIVRSNGGGAERPPKMRWWLRFAQFPGYNPLAPVIVLGRVSGANTGVYPGLGICPATTGPGDLTAIQADQLVSASIYSTLDSSPDINLYSRMYQQNAVVPRDTAYAGTPLDTVIGIHWESALRRTMVAHRWYNRVPNPVSDEDAILDSTLATISKLPRSLAVDMSQLGATFFAAGSSANPDLKLRNIYVLQPKVAV